jgi:hypothetical protein
MEFQLSAAELADDFAPTDTLYFRSLGPGYLARRIESVTRQCQCQGGIRTIDPDTREPRHYDVVVIRSAGMAATYGTDDTVHLSDRG